MKLHNNCQFLLPLASPQLAESKGGCEDQPTVLHMINSNHTHHYLFYTLFSLFSELSSMILIIDCGEGGQLCHTYFIALACAAQFPYSYSGCIISLLLPLMTSGKR